MEESIIFTFADGTIREYLANGRTIRGCRHNGKRPIKVEYPNNLDEHFICTNLLATLDPYNHEMEPLYKPLDKYVEISDKLYELHYNSHNKKHILIFGKETLWYDKTRDGEALTRDEAIDKFPEYFIQENSMIHEANPIIKQIRDINDKKKRESKGQH